MRLPCPALVLLLAGTLVGAQRIKVSQKGCLLDLSEQVAGEIRCGKRSTVTFAVEWYGSDVEELQSWLKVAGCSDDEAKAQAAWAARACQGDPVSGKMKGEASRNHELRHLHRNARRFKEVEVVGRNTKTRRDGDKSDDKGDNDPKDDDGSSSSTTSTSTSSKSTSSSSKTSSSSLSTKTSTSSSSSSSSSSKTSSSSSTLSTSTITSLASTSSYNPWVLVTTANGVNTTETCATEHSFTTSACSSYKSDGRWYTPCVTQATATPSCLDGFSCSFSSDTGDFSCYAKGTVPTYGIIIGCVLGGIALCIGAFVLVRFGMSRGAAARARRQQEAAVPSGSMGGGKGVSEAFGVAEVEAGPPGGPVQHISDTQPLMAPEYTPDPQTPGLPAGTPEIVVRPHTPVHEHDVGVQMPHMPYDPYLGGSGGYRHG